MKDKSIFILKNIYLYFITKTTKKAQLFTGYCEEKRRGFKQYIGHFVLYGN